MMTGDKETFELSEDVEDIAAAFAGVKTARRALSMIARLSEKWYYAGLGAIFDEFPDVWSVRFEYNQDDELLYASEIMWTIRDGGDRGEIALLDIDATQDLPVRDIKNRINDAITDVVPKEFWNLVYLSRRTERVDERVLPYCASARAALATSVVEK